MTILRQKILPQKLYPILFSGCIHKLSPAHLIITEES